MNRKITSHEFCAAWLEISHAQHDILVSNLPNSTQYTNCIFNSETSVLASISKKLDLKSYCNYYSLDAVFFREVDYVPEIPQHLTWLRKIRIAFEHENDCNSGLFQEVSHLLITNCDLRVLVTYPNDDHKWEMDRLHKVIFGTDDAKKILDESSFLIIHGYKSKEEKINWEGFVYNLENWIQINNITQNKKGATTAS